MLQTISRRKALKARESFSTHYSQNERELQVNCKAGVVYETGI
jgi:hypothetical protein